MFGQHRAVHLHSEISSFTFYQLTIFSSQNFLTNQTLGQVSEWFLVPKESVLGGCQKLNHLEWQDLKSLITSEQTLPWRTAGFLSCQWGQLAVPVQREKILPPSWEIIL